MGDRQQLLLSSPTQQKQQLLLSSPQRRMGRSSSAAHAALGLAGGGEAATRATRDSDRTAKIDLVQEKITSTIADLAKIMSAIPSGGISLGRIDLPGAPTGRDPLDGESQRPEEARTAARGGGTADASDAEVEQPPAASSPQGLKRKEKLRVDTQVVAKPWHKKAAASSAQKANQPTTTVTSPHCLVLEIDSNWGDANYVGMNGVELYDRAGRLIQLSGASGDGTESAESGGGVRAITAFPRDLADLPEHRDDPRKVQNLLNGINFTKNDLHSWLTPHIQLLKRVEGALPYIAKVVMELEPGVVPAMCRLFNYNRSRTRNQRGVRHFKLILDDVVQFEG